MSLIDAQPPVSEEAGWYPDPLGRDVQRYYDGSQWTDQIQKPEPLSAYTPKKRAWWRPGWRKMTWVLVLWSLLILVWAIAGGGSAANSCKEEGTRFAQEGCEAGAGIGVLLILFIGFIGFCFFSLIWFMTRPKGRECPVCGEKVKKGRTVCPGCNYDFATAAGHEPRTA